MEAELKDAFYDIITGRVKRSVHHLVYQQKDYSALFISCLQEKGYLPVILKDVTIEVGMRIPGFYLQQSTAYYGHLFWEVFHDSFKRKIWGSVVRNKKGDWKYILSGNSSNQVYLNIGKKQEVDIYHLT